MKKFFKFFLALAAVATITACSDDFNKVSPDDPNGGGTDGPGVYLGISFSMPGMGQTGRSFTSDDNMSNSGTEVGSDVENNINEVMLVLARPDNYGFIAASTVPNNKIFMHGATPENANATFHATAKITKTSLNQYYDDGDATKNGAKVAVFVIVNPSGAIVDVLNSESLEYGDNSWIQTIGKVTATGTQTEGAIWSTTNGGSFLMTNRDIAIRQLPATIEDWNAYTKEDKTFNLSTTNTESGIDNSSDNGGGAVIVERVAARMDFRDGSGNNNTYHVIYQTNPDGTDDLETPIVDVQLNKMCLVNMNNSFYYLPRVSDDGLNGTPATATANNWILCGPEKPWYTNLNGVPTTPVLKGNYVVSTYAKEKADGTIITKNSTTGSYSFDTYFNYPFFQNDGEVDNNNAVLGSAERWYVSSIDDVLTGRLDNWANSEGKTGTYHVWRYLTENTIPGPVTLQTNGITTGVVFKGKMIANEDAKLDLGDYEEGTPEYKNAKARNELIDAINNDTPEFGNSYRAPFLYYVDGSIYVSWENLYQAAINASFSYEWNADKTGIIVSWNRKTTLYKAVFGDKDGLTGYSITVTPLNSDGTAYGDPITYTDEVAVDDTTHPFYATKGLDPSSPNYLYIEWNKDGRKEAEAGAFKKAATGNNITIYQRSNDSVNGWGYYCYYYYWNRHNDNGNSGIMSQMEFGVVRNNVYKLAVTKIARIGHPRIFANDPLSPTPDTPNESEDVYITVDSEVIPWVVRVNNIVFD